MQRSVGTQIVELQSTANITNQELEQFDEIVGNHEVDIQGSRQHQNKLFGNRGTQLLPPTNKVCEGYVFTPVCHSVHGGSVCPSACWNTTPATRGRHPLGPEADPPGAEADTITWDQRQTPPPGPEADTLQEQTPPGSGHPPMQCMLGDTGNKRVVRILLEYILVS